MEPHMIEKYIHYLIELKFNHVGFIIIF